MTMTSTSEHGGQVQRSEVEADPWKTGSGRSWIKPTDAKGFQQFVGFVNYPSRFMPHLSEACEPPRRLLNKDMQWYWLPKHDMAMKELKVLVTAVPVLRYYHVNKPVTIKGGSSQTGLGSMGEADISQGGLRDHHPLPPRLWTHHAMSQRAGPSPRVGSRISLQTDWIFRLWLTKQKDLLLMHDFMLVNVDLSGLYVCWVHVILFVYSVLSARDLIDFKVLRLRFKV